MPHVHMYITPDLDETTRLMLAELKSNIRTVISNVIGYEPEVVAIVPHLVSVAEMELADNMLPLEFVIETGERAFFWRDTHARAVGCTIISRVPILHKVNFGVWIKNEDGNGFWEHKPA